MKIWRQEKSLLIESLNGEIIKLLNQKNALSHDFETLIGGIIYVIDSLKKDDPESNQNQQIWKKTGSGYFTPAKRIKASIDTNAAF